MPAEVCDGFYVSAMSAAVTLIPIILVVLLIATRIPSRMAEYALRILTGKTIY